jgi:hypothetical protein
MLSHYLLSDSPTSLLPFPCTIVSHHLLSSISAPKGNTSIRKGTLLEFPTPNESHRRLLFVVLYSNLTHSPSTIEISDILALGTRHTGRSNVDICPLQIELTPLHPEET